MTKVFEFSGNNTTLNFFLADDKFIPQSAESSGEGLLCCIGLKTYLAESLLIKTFSWTTNPNTGKLQYGLFDVSAIWLSCHDSGDFLQVCP